MPDCGLELGPARWGVWKRRRGTGGRDGVGAQGLRKRRGLAATLPRFLVRGGLTARSSVSQSPNLGRLFRR